MDNEHQNKWMTGVGGGEGWGKWVEIGGRGLCIHVFLAKHRWAQSPSSNLSSVAHSECRL